MQGLIFLRPESSAWVDTSEHNLFLSFVNKKTTVGLLYAGVKRECVVTAGADALPYDEEQNLVWAIQGEAATTVVPTRNESFRHVGADQLLLDSIIQQLHAPTTTHYLDRVVEACKGLVTKHAVVVHTGVQHTIVNIIAYGTMHFWYVYYKGNAAIFFSDDLYADALQRMEAIFHYKDMRVGAAVHIASTVAVGISVVSLNLEYLRGKHRKWLTEFRNNILTMTSIQDYVNTRTKQLPE